MALLDPMLSSCTEGEEEPFPSGVTDLGALHAEDLLHESTTGFGDSIFPTKGVVVTCYM